MDRDKATCATDGCLAIDYLERISELEAKVERLEKAIQHCDPLCPAWAVLEGKQDD